MSHMEEMAEEMRRRMEEKMERRGAKGMRRKTTSSKTRSYNNTISSAKRASKAGSHSDSGTARNLSSRGSDRQQWTCRLCQKRRSGGTEGIHYYLFCPGSTGDPVRVCLSCVGDMMVQVTLDLDISVLARRLTALKGRKPYMSRSPLMKRGW